MLNILNQQIRRAFSNAALHYEVLSGMQYEIGRELIAQIPPDKEYERFLDVGMGTGKLTNRLAMNFPETKVIGLDLADGMVDQARKQYDTFCALQGDATHLPFQDRQFDVVISNCSYQWVFDLRRAFAEVHRVLKPQGEFYITLFGYETLKELYDTLRDTHVVAVGSVLNRLPRQELVESALKDTRLKGIELKTERTQTHFENLPELLRWGKSIGANVLNSGISLGPQRLAKAAEHYERHYSAAWGITATFEIIWVKGSYE